MLPFISEEVHLYVPLSLTSSLPLITSCPEVVISPLGIDGVQVYLPVEEGPTGWLIIASIRILIESRGTRGQKHLK